MPRSALGWALAAGLMILGCSDGEVTAPELPEEDRGVPLGTSAYHPLIPWEWQQLVWSADGREVFHPRGRPGEEVITAVDVATRSSRPISNRPSSCFRITADGAWLFADHDAPGEIIRYPTAGGTGRLLAESAGSRPFAISADGRLVVFVRHDSLRVLDLGTGEERAVRASEAAPFETVSPDGRWVPVAGLDDDVYRVDLETGDSVRVLISSPGDSPPRRPWALRWTSDSRLRILYASDDALWIHEEGRSDRHVVTIESRFTLHESPAGWSPDGDLAALWVEVGCASGDGLLCPVTRHELYLVDVGAGTLRSIGSANLPDLQYASAPAFSPDGTALAYVLEGRVYWKEVPSSP